MNLLIYKLQGGHYVRNYGMYGIEKKMYGIVRNENWCTVRTKIGTDVRNSRKGLKIFFLFTQLQGFFLVEAYKLS